MGLLRDFHAKGVSFRSRLYYMEDHNKLLNKAKEHRRKETRAEGKGSGRMKRKKVRVEKETEKVKEITL